MSFSQLRLEGYDSGASMLRSTAQVLITVLRTQNGPAFNQNTYRVTIHEDKPVRQYILPLNVSDPDQVSLPQWLPLLLGGVRGREV